MSPGVQLGEKMAIDTGGWSGLARVGQDKDPGDCWGLVYAALL